MDKLTEYFDGPNGVYYHVYTDRIFYFDRKDKNYLGVCNYTVEDDSGSYPRCVIELYDHQLTYLGEL